MLRCPAKGDWTGARAAVALGALDRGQGEVLGDGPKAPELQRARRDMPISSSSSMRRAQREASTSSPSITATPSACRRSRALSRTERSTRTAATSSSHCQRSSWSSLSSSRTIARSRRRCSSEPAWCNGQRAAGSSPQGCKAGGRERAGGKGEVPGEASKVPAVASPHARQKCSSGGRRRLDAPSDLVSRATRYGSLNTAWVPTRRQITCGSPARTSAPYSNVARPSGENVISQTLDDP